MTNPRGPMVPHEMRARLDRSRLFYNTGLCINNLADTLYRGQFTKDEIENRVIEAEKAIKEASIEIRRMKDEATNS